MHLLQGFIISVIKIIESAISATTSVVAAGGRYVVISIHLLFDAAKIGEFLLVHNIYRNI